MKYQSLYNIYIDAVKRMANEEGYWKEFLKYAGNMYRYKFSTLVTAYAQNPKLEQLVSYEDWKRLGYYIRKGEKSIPVLMDNHFRMSHMFDISQLEKQPILKNWEVRDKDIETFKTRFVEKNQNIQEGSLNGFEDLKAARILNDLNVMYDNTQYNALLENAELIYQSIDFMISERCNLPHKDSIPQFEVSHEQMTAVGWCTMTVARGILLESKEIVNEIRRERDEQHRDALRREGGDLIRGGGGGEEGQTKYQAAEQIRTNGKTILGKEPGIGTGRTDNSGENGSEDGRAGHGVKEDDIPISDKTSERESSDVARGATSDGREESNPESVPTVINEKEVESEDSTSFFSIKYFAIDEKLAKAAHVLMSFNEYVPDSKTNGYKALVNEVYDIADKVAERKPEETERAYKLAAKYSKRLADNLNKESRIGCMCPSVMISGAGNFPVKKKEKQNAAAEKNFREREEIEEIREKLVSILNGQEIIKADDENALTKLESKLAALRKEQENMKAVNAFYRKHKTLEGCPGISAEAAEIFMKDSTPGKKPFPSYKLTNNNQNIHRVEERLEQLKQAKSVESSEGSLKYFKVIRNRDLMRLQLIFEEKPNDETRSLLKHKGFKWSPKNGAWQRQLTRNAEYSLKSIVEILDEQNQSTQQGKEVMVEEAVEKLEELSENNVGGEKMIDASTYSKEMHSNRHYLSARDIDKILYSRKENEPISFENCEISKVNFVGINFKECNFKDCKFYECQFENCSFEKSNFESSEFLGYTVLNDCNFRQVNFEKSLLCDVFSQSTDFSDANFSLCHVKSCSFNDETIFHNNEFFGMEINEAYFRNIDVLAAKNLDTISITMGGATNHEIEKHAKAIMEALNGNGKPTEQCYKQHVNTNLRYCKKQLDLIKAIESSNMQNEASEELEMEM